MYIVCADGQCCYFYGSVPLNDSNCVPENGRFILNCIVYNPRDNFTNLTVRWFRTKNATRATSSTEVITSGEYILSQTQVSGAATSSTVNTNCTHGSLYEDVFLLVIPNFATDKDGYYWCQIVINDSYLQPSQYTLLYAADKSSCTVTQEPQIITAPPRCAENYTSTYRTATTGTSVTARDASTTYYSTFVDTTLASNVTAPSTSVTNTTSVAMVVASFSTTHSTTVTNTLATTSVPTMTTVVFRATESIIYVAGFFSVLILLLVALVVIVILLLHVHKTRRKKKGELIYTFLCDFQHVHACSIGTSIQLHKETHSM